MEPTTVVYDVCRNYLADLTGTLEKPLLEKLLGYVRSRSLKDLCESSSLYDHDYHGHLQLRALLQVEAFFKKCSHFSSESCSKAGMDAFLESEEVCKTTNERLDKHFTMSHENDLFLKCERMRQIISRILGSRADFISDLPSLIRSTNGATAAHPRRSSGGFNRIKRTMYATERSHPYLKALSKFWGYTINFRKIHHNRVELVPKNWKTHRTIACEPEGNSALQLAFDTFCKRQLKKSIRIDLSDQSRNQRLAYEGSIDGFLSTIDLKAASDRLSLNVVHLLFEREWVDFFLDTRSPCWKDSLGNLVPYSKLSSMGNGYTFTIETLVFAAACEAIGSKHFSVYGDDIIVETDLCDDLVALLTYLGFEVNQDKSHTRVPVVKTALPPEYFKPILEGADPDLDPVNYAQTFLSELRCSASTIHGTYRESCGKHYFGGKDITPLFIRDLTTRRDWVLLINNLISLGAPGGSLWNYAVGIVRQLKLPLGPPTLDTASCVFIDVQSCYRRGLIRTRKRGRLAWQPAYKGLCEASRVSYCYDSRSLFLWYLHRKEKPYESSGHTSGTYKCRLRWVRYRPAMADIMGGSVHLHWWTEVLLARES